MRALQKTMISQLSDKNVLWSNYDSNSEVVDVEEFASRSKNWTVTAVTHEIYC